MAFLLLSQLGCASAQKQSSNRPSGDQNAALQYTVTADAPTLFEIGVLLYGDSRAWQEILAANPELESRKLSIGQTLTLPRSALYSEAEGRKVLLNFWRAHFRLPAEMVSPAEDPKSRETLAELVRTPEDKSSTQAAELLNEGQTERALERFKAERRAHPELLPNWFYELQCLKLLLKRKELEATLAEFELRFPHLRSIPAVRQYRQGVSQ